MHSLRGAFLWRTLTTTVAEPGRERGLRGRAVSDPQRSTLNPGGGGKTAALASSPRFQASWSQWHLSPFQMDQQRDAGRKRCRCRGGRACAPGRTCHRHCSSSRTFLQGPRRKLRHVLVTSAQKWGVVLSHSQSASGTNTAWKPAPLRGHMRCPSVPLPHTSLPTAGSPAGNVPTRFFQGRQTSSCFNPPTARTSSLAPSDRVFLVGFCVKPLLLINHHPHHHHRLSTLTTCLS